MHGIHVAFECQESLVSGSCKYWWGAVSMCIRAVFKFAKGVLYYYFPHMCNCLKSQQLVTVFVDRAAQFYTVVVSVDYSVM